MCLLRTKETKKNMGDWKEKQGNQDVMIEIVGVICLSDDVVLGQV